MIEQQGIRATYVALSHCWVNREILKTTKDTLATRLSSVLFSVLPPTFQQAVMLCRWLGVQYLWIDSLCIIQDDSPDWEEQASKMDDIYENAFFTLAAHGGPTSSIYPTPAEHELSTHLPITEGVIRVRSVPVHDFPSPEGVVLGGIGENSPSWISGRGWCYQERFLSSQILYFTHFEVLHEDQRGRIRCQCQCSDAHVHFLPDIQKPNVKDPKDPSRLWRRIVKQYSLKAFTREWDILHGLAGIARRFQQYHQPGAYFAGLWENDIARWLCWRSVRPLFYGALHSGCERFGVWPHRLNEQPPQEEYVVPSISWASKVGACEFLEAVWEEEAMQKVQIRGFRCERGHQNPFGRFTECAVDIQGHILDAGVISTVGKDRKYLQNCRTEYAHIVFPHVFDELDPLDPEWYETAVEKATQYDFDATDDIPGDYGSAELFVYKADSICLILKALENNSYGEEQCYRRVGLCKIASYWFTAERQDYITLV